MDDDGAAVRPLGPLVLLPEAHVAGLAATEPLILHDVADALAVVEVVAAPRAGLTGVEYDVLDHPIPHRGDRRVWRPFVHPLLDVLAGNVLGERAAIGEVIAVRPVLRGRRPARDQVIQGELDL